MNKNKLDINELNSISGGEMSSEGLANGSLEKAQFIEQLQNKGSQSPNVQDTMRLQYELRQLNLQTESTTKIASKTGQVSQLFKNQSPSEE